MKNVVTYCVAAFMVLWYSLSVIGFDVHTCNGSGKTFIATVISGTGCDDIHPEHDAPCCSCCQCEDEADSDELRTKPCCSDDWQMIVLTGLRSDDDKSQQLFAQSVNHFSASAMLQDFIENLNPIPDYTRNFYKPRTGGLTTRSCQEVYNVWRI